MKTSWQLALAFLACSFIADGKDVEKTPSDKKFSQVIVGTWIMDFETPSWYRVNGTVTYKSNGECVWNYTVIDHGEKHVEIMEGKWSILNGILTETITNSIGIPKELHPKGKGPKSRIISINDEELIKRPIMLREITNAPTITLYRKR